MNKYSVITDESGPNVHDIEADTCEWERPTARMAKETLTTQELLLVFSLGDKRVAEFKAEHLVGWRLERQGG